MDTSKDDYFSGKASSLVAVVRRAMPQLIAYDVCSVQPMTGVNIFQTSDKIEKDRQKRIKNYKRTSHPNDSRQDYDVLRKYYRNERIPAVGNRTIIVWAIKSDGTTEHLKEALIPWKYDSVILNTLKLIEDCWIVVYITKYNPPYKINFDLELWNNEEFHNTWKPLEEKDDKLS